MALSSPKRLFDVVVSALGLVVTSPVLLLIAALVRVCDGAPVVLRQERVGRGFRPFSLLKFRTMTAGADREGDALAGDGDARITPLGRILRSTKLDELPQLWNVLRGDMSLVGPRPELPRYVALFEEEFRTILRVRPGITDAASILYRDEARLLAGSADPEALYVRTVLPHKIRLARRYLVRASLGYDVWLLATTVACLANPARAFDRWSGAVGRFRQGLSAAGQAALVVLAHFAAERVRFEAGMSPRESAVLLGSLPLLVLLRMVALEAFGLNARPWRYVDFRDLRRIAGAVLLSSIAFWFALTAVFHVSGYSRSVLLLDALFAMLLLSGARLLSRMQHGLVEDYAHAQRALLVGSGDAIDRALVRVAADRSRALEVSGIVDVDPERAGALVRGVRVLGGPRDLERLLAEHDPDLVLVEPDSITGETRRQVASVAAAYEKPCTTVAAFQRRVAGEERFPTGGFDAEALLPREPLRADLDSLRERWAGRRVLVTGAGGAIGSELARTLAALEPQVLVLFERHESSLEKIEREVRALAPALPVLAALGDVTDSERVREVLAAVCPDVVLHAAASTRAALVSAHPEAAVRTNVVGARTVARAALEQGVTTFLLVSSDEAVDPRGPLAATRRDAELAVRELHGQGATRFSAIRFPLTLDDPRGELSRFRAQIERGGPVRVASAQALVLPLLAAEASHLILEAADCARGGEVLLVDCGRPARALDLARAAVLDCGLVPGRDIEIVCVGAATEDRFSPRLCGEHETVWRTSHPRLLAIGEPAVAGPSRVDALPATAPAKLVGAEV